jgi:hypothetical protein
MGAYAGPTQSWFNSFATGGTITRVIQNNIIYRVHTFITGTGTLTVNRQFNVEYLVVAGGGGGGGGYQGGGGGAGGYLNSSTPVTTRTYTITVGAGGTGRTVGGAAATNGANSVLQDIATAVGGGRGASENPDTAPNTGGSGGGGTWWTTSSPFPLIGAAGTPGQGFAGGNGGVFAGYDQPGKFGGGGGGGSSSVGTNAADGTAGGPLQPPGGTGTSNSYSNTATVYAAGGNGALRSYGANGSSASANTGNGGNGGGNTGGSSLGGNGGSGIVIVRYPIGVITQ